MSAVRYHEESAEELLAEIRYLEVRARGLGRRFLEEVKRGESHIVQFPEAGEEVRPSATPRKSFKALLEV